MDEKLIEMIRNTNSFITENLKEMGAVKKTIEFFLEGGFVLFCPKCDTYNLCEKDPEETRKYILGYGIDVIKKYGDDAEIFYCNKCEDYAVRHKNQNLNPSE